MQFKAQIRKTGNSYVVTVPSQYVNNGLLKEGQEYEFDVQKADQEVQEE